MKRLSILSLCLLLVSSAWMPQDALAQSESTTSSTETAQSFVQVTMNDGTLKFGWLVSMDDDHVVLNIVGLGTTRIPKYLVQTLTIREVELDDEEEPMYFASNQSTRYFFAPSGIQLDKGEGYFQSNIVLNSVSYGFSSSFTGGALVGFLGGGLTAKIGGQVGDKTHISAGGIAAMDFFGALDRPLVLGFVNVTRGDKNKNVTLNLGLGNRMVEGITGYDWSSYTETGSGSNVEYVPTTRTRFAWNPLVINVSGMTPLKSNLWLITENYLVGPSLQRNISEPNTYGFSYVGADYSGNYNRTPDSFGIISLGIRSYSQRSGWLWDYGIAGYVEDGEGVPIPWFSFTMEF
ncbi:MAG: hypothetical protein ACPGAB_02450 [Flavobacteriales bacterium]